ncbi:YqgE/AlgH family protein [Paracoccus pacificus]|uniref:UPF0301 protein ACFSCT_13155 n=1 Tax=Paracoccus pacificus TaxID=1463598 RepID=A0ABW4R9E8_9RHOB
MPEEQNLTGKFLIAMPGMGDARFQRSVILICAHSAESAMGLVLNRPMPELGFPKLMEQLGIEVTGTLPVIPIHFGGPVEPSRGFVLHRVAADAAEPEGQLRISPTLALTTTRNILEDIAQGQGPDTAILSLGYAGWGPGQLEAEMLANGWLVGDPETGGDGLADEIIFGADNDSKWPQALRRQGIDPRLLSGSAGHA